MKMCEDCQCEIINNSHTFGECEQNRIKSNIYKGLGISKDYYKNLERQCFVGENKVFDYSTHFKKETKPEYNAQKLLVFLHEVVKLTEQERLVRGKDKVFKKLFEEIGEYAVASLGDKEVSESPRQEIVDVIIITISLLILEGGNLKFLAEYGMEKLEKWKNKLKNEEKI